MTTIEKKIQNLVPEKTQLEKYTHLISIIPHIGSPISGWISEKRNDKYWSRCINVLEELSSEIESLKSNQKEIFIDDNFVELTVKLFPKIASTISHKKRIRYAYLLTHSVLTNQESEREELETMADTLDQLEYRHVQLLDFIMSQPSFTNIDGLWGAHQHVTLGRKQFSVGQGKLLYRMKYLGLLDYKVEKAPEYKVQIEINSFGQSFHEWITKPLKSS